MSGVEHPGASADDVGGHYNNARDVGGQADTCTGMGLSDLPFTNGCQTPRLLTWA